MVSGDVLAASAVIVDDLHRVLLVRRGHAPAEGLWSLPGGSVEAGESIEGAVSREVHEETGLIVDVGGEVWRVRVELAPGAFYDVRAHRADVKGGKLHPGDDAEEAAWVDRASLDDYLLTPNLREFLHRYLRSG